MREVGEGEKEVAEMRKLRFSLRVTRKDKNECTKVTLKVDRFGWKVWKSRLRWYSHVEHQDDDFFILFRVSSYQIVNSVCWSHALVNGPTSKRPASDGGLCSGQLLMMCSAVCSGSPHWRAALAASPYFFMDALYRPTPVRSLFRVVQCFRLRSSPLTPSPGMMTMSCGLNGAGDAAAKEKRRPKRRYYSNDVCSFLGMWMYLHDPNQLPDPSLLIVCLSLVYYLFMSIPTQACNGRAVW